MNNTPITYRFFRSGMEGTFEERLIRLLHLYTPEGIPVRFVLFDTLPDNDTYTARLHIIRQVIVERFADCVPVISYVAQAPCGDGLVLEVHELTGFSPDAVHYKEGYVTVEQPGYKFLFLGGVHGASLADSISRQSQELFDKVEKILAAEAMPVASIVRQWNYIEKIVAVDSDGHQHYQDFNDVRSRFYSQADWKEGYPAATGIGTQWGGVMVDIDALLVKEKSVAIYPLDNPLQVPAHAYSGGVLLGGSEKTTPKFERGKALAFPDGGMIYVSGTAAIRGEHSLTGIGIEAQTRATLENIAFLISKENLKASGVSATSDASLQILRVYVKQEKDEAAARAIIEKALPNLPVVYVVADVCRDELLIEMEGAAGITDEEPEPDFNLCIRAE